MDQFDFKILQALQADGRLTSQDLSALVGLSASQCARRRAHLEQSGVIAGYHARVSQNAVGLGLIVFIDIALDTHSVGAAERLRDLLQTMEEVTEAYAMTGTTDYHVKLVVPDLKALSHIINERLLPHDGVSQVRSAIVLDKLKETSAVSLSHLRQ